MLFVEQKGMAGFRQVFRGWVAVTTTVHTLPFGAHKGRPLPDVPADYLRWALAECKLSSGLYAAVAAELARRGLPVPPPPPPKPPPACACCGPAGKVRYRWSADRLGRPHIRAECRRCRRFLGLAPQVEPYTQLADVLEKALRRDRLRCLSVQELTGGPQADAAARGRPLEASGVNAIGH